MSQYNTIRKIIVEWLDDNYHFGDTDVMLTSDQLSFMDNAILDSVGFVQLVLFLEDRFGIVLDRKDLSRENFDGMEKIITYLTTHKDFQGS